MVQSSAALIQEIGSYGYDMYWDVVPYFNHDNYRKNPQRIFAEASINLFALHPQIRRARHRTLPVDLSRYTKIRNDETGWYLHQYPNLIHPKVQYVETMTQTGFDPERFPAI